MSNKPLFSNIPTPILKKAGEYIDYLVKEREKNDNEQPVNNTPAEPSFRTKNTTYQDSISMTDIIEWAKNNAPAESGVSLTALKEKSTKVGYAMALYLIYAINGKPLLDNKYESLVIYCNRMSDDLYNAFGGQDIIVFE